LGGRDEPVSRVVGVGIRSVREQIPIRIPGVGYTGRVDEPVGNVIGVDGRVRQRGLRQPVADRILSVREHAARAVIRDGQPAQWVIFVRDVVAMLLLLLSVKPW